MKKIWIILLLVFNLILNAQTRSLDIGLCSSIPAGNIPDLSYGPYVNYSTGNHQIEAGADIYNIHFQSKLYLIGTRVSYKYLLLDQEKKVNFFPDLNLQYVGYATGTQWAVSYNYGHSDMSLVRYRSFSSTLGIGLQAKLLKNFKFIWIIGGGYNLWKSSYAPENNNHWGGSQGIGTYAKPIIYTRLGLSYRIWKKRRGCVLPDYTRKDKPVK